MSLSSQMNTLVRALNEATRKVHNDKSNSNKSKITQKNTSDPVNMAMNAFHRDLPLRLIVRFAYRGWRLHSQAKPQASFIAYRGHQLQSNEFFCFNRTIKNRSFMPSVAYRTLKMNKKLFSCATWTWIGFELICVLKIEIVSKINTFSILFGDVSQILVVYCVDSANKSRYVCMRRIFSGSSVL